MKTLLIRIIGLVCDLAESLLELFTDAVTALWNFVRRCRCSALGKIVLAFAVIAALGTAAVSARRWYKERHSRYYYYEKQLSKSVETHYFRDCMTRVYNIKTGRYTTPRLDWVSDTPDRDSLTVFCRKDRRGFLDVNDGTIVIEAQYDKAWVFSEGVAAVVKDSRIGFINARNEVVIPFRYYYSARNGRAIDYVFRDGYCTMTDERGACGVIDRDGNWVIEPQYDCIWTPHGDGYRVVKDGDKYGLLGPDLQFVYPVEYDCIDFSAGDAGVLLSLGGRKWQVDFDGTVTRPFVVDYTEWLYVPGSYNEEACSSRLSDYVLYSIESRVGVLRRDTGRIVIPAVYESINMLSETLFEVLLREGGNWILIDSDGNIVEN